MLECQMHEVYSQADMFVVDLNIILNKTKKMFNKVEDTLKSMTGSEMKRSNPIAN